MTSASAKTWQQPNQAMQEEANTGIGKRKLEIVSVDFSLNMEILIQ